MYSLFWTRSELPSHYFHDYDGDFICTDSWVTYWTYPLVAEKNCNSRISLSHSSIPFISTWDTHSIIHCKCVYFLPFSCPVFINLIFVILYHFSPRNYIDENRRFVDCISCILSIYTDSVIRHHRWPFDQLYRKTKTSVLFASATQKITPSQTHFIGCVQTTS